MKQDEFGPLPREYPDHPPEQAAPGPEFAEHAPTFPEKPKRNRFALVAAAVLMAFMLMFEATPAVPADIITPSPAPVTEMSLHRNPSPLPNLLQSRSLLSLRPAKQCFSHFPIHFGQS